MVGRGFFFDSEVGTIFERLRISRMSRMVNRDGDGAGEGGGGD